MSEFEQKIQKNKREHSPSWVSYDVYQVTEKFEMMVPPSFFGHILNPYRQLFLGTLPRMTNSAVRKVGLKCIFRPYVFYDRSGPCVPDSYQ